jgi:diadenosine tetraphosphate (Ap4A) HIT family hydrolase
VKTSTSSCPFCVGDGDGDLFLHNSLAYARCDAHPVTPGHLLIIPFRHVANYFDTTHEERVALLQLLDEAKALLDESLAPAGYNIGVNVGDVAGQTISHVHMHLIPRYHGDTENPRGGVRGVIPSKQSYP